MKLQFRFRIGQGKNSTMYIHTFYSQPDYFVRKIPVCRMQLIMIVSLIDATEEIRFRQYDVFHLSFLFSVINSVICMRT